MGVTPGFDGREAKCEIPDNRDEGLPLPDTSDARLDNDDVGLPLAGARDAGRLDNEDTGLFGARSNIPFLLPADARESGPLINAGAGLARDARSARLVTVSGCCPPTLRTAVFRTCGLGSSLGCPADPDRAVRLGFETCCDGGVPTGFGGTVWTWCQDATADASSSSTSSVKDELIAADLSAGIASGALFRITGTGLSFGSLEARLTGPGVIIQLYRSAFDPMISRVSEGNS
jgi:hypothetical protein